jgi:hypothetical protein
MPALIEVVVMRIKIIIIIIIIIIIEVVATHKSITKTYGPKAQHQWESDRPSWALQALSIT